LFLGLIRRSQVKLHFQIVHVVQHDERQFLIRITKSGGGLRGRCLGIARSRLGFLLLRVLRSGNCKNVFAFGNVTESEFAFVEAFDLPGLLAVIGVENRTVAWLSA